MSLVPASRATVVLRAASAGALSGPERAQVARLLLERGLEVACRRDDGVAAVDVDAASPDQIAATLADRAGAPAAAAAWKP